MITVTHDKFGDLTFKDGTTTPQITNYLIELEAVGGEQYGMGESFIQNMERSTSSSLRSIGDWVGFRDEVNQYKDKQEEFKSRVMFEQNPASSVTGMLFGGLLDPVTLPAFALKPLTFASKVGTYASRGMAQGGLGGALEPVYEQYGDSTALNIMTGMGLGAGLGAGIGKILTKSSSPKLDDTPDLKDETEAAISAVADAAGDVPVRSVAQAQAKIQAELEIEAKGAPTQKALDDLGKTIERTKSQVGQIDNILATLKGSTGKPTKVPKLRIRANQLEAQKVEANKTIQQLEVQKAEGDVLRKAAINLENLKLGKFSKFPELQSRVQQASGVIPRSRIAESVADRNGSTVKGSAGFGVTPTGGQRGTGAVLPRPFTNAVPEAMTPFNANTNRILGFESSSEKATRLGVGSQTGAARSRFNQPNQSISSAGGPSKASLVGGELLPRTAGKPETTAKVAEGGYKGGDPDKVINIKESNSVKEARAEVQAKMNAGEELTDADIRKLDDVKESDVLLKEYADTAMKVAGSRGLDTAALRGMMRGRHTFKNIDAASRTLLKKNGIEDFEDMIDFILANDDRIFSAPEMRMLQPLFNEVERKLFNAYDILGKSTDLTDETIALIHSDINLFYGIQAWNKGQGSKVSAALNHRRKMLQDIADNRMIDSLFAGVKCK